jgi:hypothetical protein
LKHRGKEEAEEGKILPLMNADDADLNGKNPFAADFTLMNTDQERRVKFEAETNYNKGFRLTRRDCMRLCPLGEAV